MGWSLARLRPIQIAIVSVVYWLGLTAVKLGGAILSIWWVSRLPPNHGSVNAGFQNGLLHLTVLRDGKELWSGSTSLGMFLALVLGPPLLLALTARWSRLAENAGPAPTPELPGDSALPTSPIDWSAPADDPERTRVVDPRPEKPDTSARPGRSAR
ncbi:MAG: hypothetical protein ACTHM9_06750 [Gemmatimonadales bacterium]